MSTQPPSPATFRTVKSQNGEVWATYTRDSETIVVDFPGYASFRLADGKIVERQSQASEDVVTHLLENQITPLLWSQSGNVALHAGAVVHHGRAIAFVGDTGFGKSTLTTYLAGQGTSLITDDTLLIERKGDAFLALPGSSKIRLWRDSGDYLLGPRADTLPAFSFTSKGRFEAGKLFRLATEPVPLTRLYFLESNDVDAPFVNPLAGSEALFACTGASFLLDWMDREATSKHFDNVTALCGAVESYRLDYPRQYDALDTVRDLVLEE